MARSRRKPTYNKYCHAPRKRDGYPCQRGIKSRDRTCWEHKGFRRIPEWNPGPVYLPGYHDELLGRRSRKTGRQGRFDAALRSATVFVRDEIGPDWNDSVRYEGMKYLSPRVLRRATSRSAFRRCEHLADLAQSSFDDAIGELGMRLILQAVFPCAGFEELLFEELIGGFSSAANPEVVAGRAVQLMGIHACLSCGHSVSECASARRLLQREGSEAFRVLMIQGGNDWLMLSELNP